MMHIVAVVLRLLMGPIKSTERANYQFPAFAALNIRATDRSIPCKSLTSRKRLLFFFFFLYPIMFDIVKCYSMLFTAQRVFNDFSCRYFKHLNRYSNFGHTNPVFFLNLYNADENGRFAIQIVKI